MLRRALQGGPSKDLVSHDHKLLIRGVDAPSAQHAHSYLQEKPSVGCAHEFFKVEMKRFKLSSPKKKKKKKMRTWTHLNRANLTERPRLSRTQCCRTANLCHLEKMRCHINRNYTVIGIINLTGCRKSWMYEL